MKGLRYSDEPTKYPREWEDVSLENSIKTERLKVHGGWIVNTISIKIGTEPATSVFVPDQHHFWDLEDI